MDKWEPKENEKVGFESSFRRRGPGTEWALCDTMIGQGVIRLIDVGTSRYSVETKDKWEYRCTRRQLRRLKKKERREWVVRLYPEKGVYGGEAFNCSCDVSDSPECKERYNCIRVREVKSK